MPDLDDGAAAPAAAPISPAVVANTTPPAPVPLTGEAAESALTSDLDAAWNRMQQPQTSKPRAPDGKFAPANGAQQPPPNGQAEAAPAAAEGAPTTESADPPAEPTPGQVASPATTGPVSWSAAMRAKLSALPPEFSDVIEYAARRDSEQNLAIDRAGQKVKQYDVIDQIAQHYQQDLAMRGVTLPQATATLFAAQRALDNNPAQGLVQIGDSYGIDLRPFFQAAQGSPAQQPQQPQIDPVVMTLAQRLQQLEGHLTAQETGRRETEVKSVERVIAEFASDPKHSDFAELEADIVATLPVIRQAEPNLSHRDALAKAHERARWANPVTRARLQQEQVKSAEDQRRAVAEKAAQKAKQDAGVNVGSSVTATNSPRTLDEEIDANASRLYGRG